jgi:hypothetical protein
MLAGGARGSCDPAGIALIGLPPSR